MIVIRQENKTYKSTPFQVVFSSSFIKNIDRARHRANPNYKINLFVNGEFVDIPIKIDSNSGRVLFQKVKLSLMKSYNRKMSNYSDSSDYSDDDLSQKSTGLDSRISQQQSRN